MGGVVAAGQNLRVRRETVGARRQMRAHLRQIVGRVNEDARGWAALPAPQQICPESGRLLGATVELNENGPAGGRASRPAPTPAVNDSAIRRRRL